MMYLIPLNAVLPYGTFLFAKFSFLKYLVIPTIPIVILERSIPFGSFLFFIILFLAIVRNPQIPYFLRFNTFQSILLNIVLIIAGFVFQILPTEIIANVIFVSMIAIIIFSIYKCINGNEPDLPLISEAVRIQI